MLQSTDLERLSNGGGGVKEGQMHLLAKGKQNRFCKWTRDRWMRRGVNRQEGKGENTGSNHWNGGGAFGEQCGNLVK